MTDPDRHHAHLASDAHKPVLIDEVIAALEPADGELIVDATFGRGGYAEAILRSAACRVIGLDRDPEAVASGERMARQWDGRLKVYQACFSDMDRVAGAPADGVAMDLGVSSPQIDSPGRGFSFRHDGPLDMRMGDDGPTAADVVNSMSESDLADIIHFYGEERHARRVARAITARRTTAPITRTTDLADVVRGAVRRSKDGIDPATRTFQALRIHVNDELGELDRGLCAAERLLRPGGRLAVVSFHSLEDRRVKNFLRERSGAGSAPSRHSPAGLRPSDLTPPTFRLNRRKPILPRESEVRTNPRAGSARLRAAIRTEAAPWVGAAGATP